MEIKFCIVHVFLIIFILFETSYAKGGGSRSFSGGSFSGGYYSGSYHYYSGGYHYHYGYYDGGYYHVHYSSGSGYVRTIIPLATICGIIFCCWCCYQIFNTRNGIRRNNQNNGYDELNGNAASFSEYKAAIIYSLENPPQVSPPDFVGEVRMIVDGNAKSEVRNSVDINPSGNVVKFNRWEEDRCVQSNVRIKGYYEVTISTLRNNVVIALGYATKPYPPFRLPGWEKNSVAYHSDNGYKFFNDPGDGFKYGPQYGQGDIIGCGYTNNPNGDQNFFFTRNGKHLGVATTTNYLTGETFAIIGADGECSLSINFGNDVKKPFLCQAINFGIGSGPEVQMGLPVSDPPSAFAVSYTPADAKVPNQNTDPQQPKINAPIPYQPPSNTQQSTKTQSHEQSNYDPPKYQNLTSQQPILDPVQPVQMFVPPPTYKPIQNENTTSQKLSVNQNSTLNQYQAPPANYYAVPPPNQQAI